MVDEIADPARWSHEMLGRHLHETVARATQEAGHAIAAEAAPGEADDLVTGGKALRSIDRLAEMRLADREQVLGGRVGVEHIEPPVAKPERAQGVDRGQADHEPHARMAQQFDEDIGVFLRVAAAATR